MRVCKLLTRIVAFEENYKWYGFWITNKTPNHNCKDDIIIYSTSNRIVKTSNNYFIEKIIDEYRI